jgi:hypothetical protein
MFGLSRVGWMLGGRRGFRFRRWGSEVVVCLPADLVFCGSGCLRIWLFADLVFCGSGCLALGVGSATSAFWFVGLRRVGGVIGSLGECSFGLRRRRCWGWIAVRWGSAGS